MKTTFTIFLFIYGGNTEQRHQGLSVHTYYYNETDVTTAVDIYIYIYIYIYSTVINYYSQLVAALLLAFKSHSTTVGGGIMIFFRK